MLVVDSFKMAATLFDIQINIKLKAGRFKHTMHLEAFAKSAANGVICGHR